MCISIRLKSEGRFATRRKMKTAQTIVFSIQQIRNLDIITNAFTVMTEFLEQIFWAILGVITVVGSFLWSSAKSLCFLLLESLQWTGNQLVEFLHWTWIELNLLYQSIVAFLNWTRNQLVEFLHWTWIELNLLYQSIVAFLNWGIETNGSIFIIGIVFSIVVIALLCLGILFQVQHHKKNEDFYLQNLEIQTQRRNDEEKTRIQRRSDEQRARNIEITRKIVTTIVNLISLS